MQPPWQGNCTLNSRTCTYRIYLSKEKHDLHLLLGD